MEEPKDLTCYACNKDIGKEWYEYDMISAETLRHSGVTGITEIKLFCEECGQHLDFSRKCWEITNPDRNVYPPWDRDEAIVRAIRVKLLTNMPPEITKNYYQVEDSKWKILLNKAQNEFQEWKETSIKSSM